MEFECLKKYGMTKEEFVLKQDIKCFKKTDKETKKYIIKKHTYKKKKLKKRKNKIEYIKKYNDYLKTTHWKQFRKNYWKIERKICYCCGEEAKDLHHFDYKKMWKEKNSDIIPLCRKCHNEIHTLIINDKKIKLKNAHYIYKKLLG